MMIHVYIYFISALYTTKRSINFVNNVHKYFNKNLIIGIKLMHKRLFINKNIKVIYKENNIQIKYEIKNYKKKYLLILLNKYELYNVCYKYYKGLKYKKKILNENPVGLNRLIKNKYSIYYELYVLKYYSNIFNIL